MKFFTARIAQNFAQMLAESTTTTIAICQIAMNDFSIRLRGIK